MEWRSNNRSWPPAVRLAGVLCLMIFVYVAGTGSALAQGPFSGFAGSWAGSGSVTFNNGASERIRCRSQYSTSSGDNALEQTLRCASASYQFQLNTDIKHSNGTISGSWTESTNDVSGQVTGQASDGRIRAVVKGSGFEASVAVTMAANSQSVRMRPQGEKVREVSIELQRN